MLLTVDAGNTNVTLALYKDEKLLYSARIYSERHRTSDQYAHDFKQILEGRYTSHGDFKGAVIGSVVPEITRQLAYAAEFITGKKPVILGVGVKTRLQIKEINRGELGADLVAGAVGAKEKYPMPCLIWDLGTCTKISVLNERGEYLGCSISPGVKMEIEALGTNTSQLNQIDISDYDRPFGNTTFTAISSGVPAGTAVMLEGLSRRIIEENGFQNTTIVLTGGCAGYILPGLSIKGVVQDPWLISDGLRAIYAYNEKEPRA